MMKNAQAIQILTWPMARVHNQEDFAWLWKMGGVFVKKKARVQSHKSQYSCLQNIFNCDMFDKNLHMYDG